ncbi:LuxR family transcriptional regulator [Kitasatospora terrestris]|uniref:LuxR family transcriptional regulator n=2 Tax=Kitasatospora terrestris TaxID=258051 RepID=A0ABP9DGM4_9ACTN
MAKNTEAPGRAWFEFVGRREELSAVAAAVRQAPSVVLLEGEAGVGKSRLLREVEPLVRDADLAVLVGWCHPLREPLPFGPVVEALRRARPYLAGERPGPGAAVLAPLLPELADLLPDAPAGSATDGELRQLQMRAVHHLLSLMGPVVLVVEDVHWADQATRDLLLLLARNPPPQLRLVLTYRAQDLPDHGNVLGAPYRRPIGVGGLETTLLPFGRGEVRELATAALGAGAASRLTTQLLDRSGGLPLVLEEDLLVLTRRGTPAGLADLAVPRALREAVNSRVSALPEDAVTVLHAASVLGAPATEELLAGTAGLDEQRTETALIAALDTGLLREMPGGRYGFRHALAAQAVGERVVGPQRRRMHRRAFELLGRQRPAPLVQIAHHARRLGSGEDWLPHAWAAADHAVEVGDDGVAADLLQQLLDEPVLPAGQRTRAAVELSRLAARRTDPTAILAALRRIVADPALTAATRGEIRLGLARTLFTLGRAEGAGEMERAVAELEADRPDLAAVSLSTLCMGIALDRTAAQDRAGMERATRLAAGTDPASRATVLANRVTLLAALADPGLDGLVAMLPLDSPELDVRRQCARALANAATCTAWAGRTHYARDLVGRAEVLADATGYRHTQEQCSLVRLGLDFQEGRWENLQEWAETIAAEAAAGSGLYVEPLLVTAWLDIARGQLARARETITTHLLPYGYFDGVVAGSAALARIEVLEGRPEQAWEVAQQALAVQRRKGIWGWATSLVPTAVLAALLAGRTADARALTDEAEAGLADSNAPDARAELLVCRGLLAADTDIDEAEDLLVRARAVFVADTRVYRAARTAEQTGRTLLAAGQPARAVRHLQDALDVFTRLGATSCAAHCQQALRECGRGAAGRGRRGDGTALSARESQVAELLASGASNRDIAAALALSPRTAEHHVANTLRKLGVTRDQVPHTVPGDRP